LKSTKTNGICYVQPKDNLCFLFPERAPKDSYHTLLKTLGSIPETKRVFEEYSVDYYKIRPVLPVQILSQKSFKEIQSVGIGGFAQGEYS